MAFEQNPELELLKLEPYEGFQRETLNGAAERRRFPAVSGFGRTE